MDEIIDRLKNCILFLTNSHLWRSIQLQEIVSDSIIYLYLGRRVFCPVLLRFPPRTKREESKIKP